MSGTSIRAHITFPNQEDKNNNESLNLYFDNISPDEKYTIQQIFANVAALPKDRENIRLWSGIVKKNHLLSWNQFGSNRYVFRLDFLLAEPAPQKSKYPFDIPDLKYNEQKTPYIKAFAEYLQKTDYPKSRYVREQMVYSLFRAAENVDFKSKFKLGLEDEPPDFYFGTPKEAIEMRELLIPEKKLQELYIQFHQQSLKYAEKFLEKGESRFLEQMEICGLAMQFITKDYPAGKPIDTFMHHLQSRFKNKDDVWYKGSFSGLFGKKNNLFKLIESFGKELRGKQEKKPTEPLSSTSSESPFVFDEKSLGKSSDIELMTFSKNKIFSPDAFPTVKSTLFVDHAGGKPTSEESTTETELTNRHPKRKDS